MEVERWFADCAQKRGELVPGMPMEEACGRSSSQRTLNEVMHVGRDFNESFATRVLDASMASGTCVSSWTNIWPMQVAGCD